jgi:S-DNA-T family DNA segregation ATPase FtsK/SpoIIIE
VTLGVDAAGPVTVDLCRDGPHALIAGTTGAGKSELLLTLVAGLVAGSRPAELSLLLIDHKGGATFDPCARLPHTVGVITDLDAASTRRALMSLTAELRRRERLLSGAGATDVEGYLAARGPADEPLARLVIIIDEFAALADEQPDFIGGLVAIAARGRSLGIHLVLATQRPEGVVSADIRANTRLRICLGVARENESRDVIDSPAAAAISRATPGRGFLRIGPGELREFQSAQVRCGAARRNAPLVTQAPTALLGLLELGHAVTEAPPGSGSHTDLDLLVDAACTAAAATGCRATAPPWLPPLPSLLTPAALPPATRPRGVVWGLVDLPALGQQHPLELDLSAGATTVITGTARSGRTTAATAIALAASAACPPDELRLWAIDAGSGLADLGRLPHCGAVVPATDPDGVERLLDYLGQEAADRRRRAGGTDPVLMLLIDSWEAIATGHDRAAQRVADQLLRLVADAPACGLHLVVTTDRGGLTGRLPATATDRVVLRLADPSELTLIGVAAKEIPRRLPAGRGFRGSDAAAIQVAADDGSMRRAAMAWPTARRPARRFDPLPARLSINDARIRGGSGPPRIVLGLAADDLAPVSLDPADIGTSFLVAGPPGSGRTGALQLLARQLDGRRVAVCCHFGSPLLDEPGVVHLPAYDQEQAAAVLDAMRRGTPGGVDVVVDDADLLAEGPLWRPLEQLIRGESGQPCVVAMAGSTDALAAAYRGPVALARRGRTGLLLHPSRAQDGELLGVRLPARLTSSGPPGRGWVALRGTATPLQLAYVPAASREPAASDPAYADDAGRSLRDCSAERTWLRPDRFEA